MELINKLNELNKNNNLTQEEILKITSKENLFFLLMESKQNTPVYNSVYQLFEELRKNIFEKGEMNIFEEYLTIKLVYLKEVYKVDSIILDSLIILLGPVYLDYELENQFFEEDKFYNFLIKRYKEYKADNELSILKMLNSLDFGSLKLDLKELEGVFEEFKRFVPKEDLN